MTNLCSRLRALERAASAIPSVCPRCGPAPVTDQVVLFLDGKTPELGECDRCGGRLAEDSKPLGHRVTVIVCGETPKNPPPLPGAE